MEMTLLKHDIIYDALWRGMDKTLAGRGKYK